MSDLVAWLGMNQRCLAAAFDGIRARLEAQARGEPVVDELSAQLAAVEEPNLPPPVWRQLAARAGLSGFEAELLLLVAAWELDVGVQAACAQITGGGVTVGLALAWPGAFWSALLPAGALRTRWLVRLEDGPRFADRALRVDERVLHHLLGMDHAPSPPPFAEPALAAGGRTATGVVPHAASLDAALAGGAVAVRPSPTWAPEVARLVEDLSRVDRPPVVLLGGGGADPGALAAALAPSGVAVWRILAAELPAVVAEREDRAGRWNREATLGPLVLVIDARDGDAPPGALGAFVERLVGLTVVLGASQAPVLAREVWRVHVPSPTPAEQRALWAGLFRDADATGLEQPLDEIAARHRVGADEAAAIRDRVLAGPTAAREQTLRGACMLATRPALEGLAERIEPKARWEDLVLAESSQAQLRMMTGQVRRQLTVHGRWGFGRRSGGRGVTALFWGPSGTGKTMAAEVMAHSLQMDVYRIDLSAVVSKYIGETEKNLRRVFDAAEGAGALLLFDEADALFGKRSEVRDSHDRYANLEVSYLLQRMEAHNGASVLTTNQKKALDPAFLRRIRFFVPFPFPEVAQRVELWRRAFPPETPTEGLDPERLARPAFSGGNIRNVALTAAFLAADAGRAVRMSDCAVAARLELQKLERAVSDADLRDWS